MIELTVREIVTFHQRHPGGPTHVSVRLTDLEVLLAENEKLAAELKRELARSDR